MFNYFKFAIYQIIGFGGSIPKLNKIIKNPNYEADLIKLKNQQRAAEIRRELENLDGKRIRAVCENEIKNTETGETWLDFYNNQIFALRKELISITE